MCALVKFLNFVVNDTNSWKNYLGTKAFWLKLNILDVRTSHNFYQCKHEKQQNGILLYLFYLTLYFRNMV